MFHILLHSQPSPVEKNVREDSLKKKNFSDCALGCETRLVDASLEIPWLCCLILRRDSGSVWEASNQYDVNLIPQKFCGYTKLYSTATLMSSSISIKSGDLLSDGIFLGVAVNSMCGMTFIIEPPNERLETPWAKTQEKMLVYSVTEEITVRC